MSELCPGRKQGHFEDGKVVVDVIPQDCSAREQWQREFDACLQRHGVPTGRAGTDDIRHQCKTEAALNKLTLDHGEQK